MSEAPETSPDSQKARHWWRQPEGSDARLYEPSDIQSDGPSAEDSLPQDIGRTLGSLTLMATMFFLLSFWLHFPGMRPNVYSDLMDTLWVRIFNSPGIIPYVNYSLEYPAISAMVLYVSALWHDMYAFYFTVSAILFASMLGTLAILYRLLKERGQSVQAISYFMIFTPSFIFFSIYSFDWIGAFFMVASIYFAYKRRAVESGLFIGLAAAARIIPIICLPFLLLEIKKTRNRVLLLASAGAAWLAFNLYFMVTNFQGFLYPYVFQAGYNVEDSWLGLASPYAKEFSILLLGGALALIIYKRKGFNLFQQTLLAVLAFVLFSFKFPPQYMILLLPLFVLTGVGYREFIVANVLNVMLVLWYFTPAFSLGPALAITSPVQWVAYARQFVLFLVFAKLIVSGGKIKVAPIVKRAEFDQELPIPARPPLSAALVGPRLRLALLLEAIRHRND